jgi:signal peptidase I
MNGESKPLRTCRNLPVRRGFLMLALLFTFLCYGFFTWVIWPVQVAGESMMPNYRNGARYFINKFAYGSAPPQRGDVVGLRAPNGEIYLKRVIGLPGEHIQFVNGGIAIDGERLKEPYVHTDIPADLRESFHLKADEYFVIGDNRAISIFRPVPREAIIGKVVY